MKYYLCFAAMGAVLLVFFVREKLRSYCVRALFWKTAVSVMFMAAGAAAAGAIPAASAQRGFSWFVLGGLLFGLLGDIWLDLKYVYPQDDARYTYAGFTVFSIGHILFILGMLRYYADFSRPLVVIIPLVVGFALGVGNGLLGPVMKLKFGRFKGIVMFYGGILFAMTLLAGSLAFDQGFQNGALDWMFAGGILFAVSDLILSRTYFGEGYERPVDIIANYVFYYAAQFAIAASLLFVV